MPECEAWMFEPCDRDRAGVWESYMDTWSGFIAAALDKFEVKAVVSVSATAVAEAFGQDWRLVVMLFIMLGLDLVLGITEALLHRGALSGRKLHGGVIKFFMYGLTLGIVLSLQNALTASFGVRIPLLAVYAAYQLLTEASSVTRHMVRLGWPVPKLFVRILDAADKQLDGRIDDVLKDKENDHAGDN